MDTAAFNIAKVMKSLRVATHDLYEEYTQWCEDAGVRYPLAKGTFGVRLKERGFKASKSGSARLWQGLDIRGTVRD